MKPLRITVPLGIGDCHWVCQKLRGLSALHDNRPIHAYVSSQSYHTTEQFLRLVPLIQEVHARPTALYKLREDLEPGYLDLHWSQLESCRNWREFDYVLCANGHLELGERIETWLPELPTDYRYDLVVPEATPPRILLYPGGVRQNLIWHGNTWTVKHWVETVRLLNQQNHIPVLIGADNPDDMTYNRWLTKQLTMHGLSADSLVGKTSVADVFGMIKGCRVIAGLNSGLVIVAAALGVPTVLLWSNEQTRCPGSHSTLPREMQTSWLPQPLPPAYRPMSFGSRQLTPAGLVENMLEVLR